MILVCCQNPSILPSRLLFDEAATHSTPALVCHISIFLHLGAIPLQNLCHDICPSMSTFGRDTRGCTDVGALQALVPDVPQRQLYRKRRWGKPSHRECSLNLLGPLGWTGGSWAAGRIWCNHCWCSPWKATRGWGLRVTLSLMEGSDIFKMDHCDWLHMDFKTGR